MQLNVYPIDIRPDVAVLEAAMAAIDPSSVLDFDASSSTLRVSTLLDPAQVAQTLSAAGLPVDTGQVTRVPSECCGGCGG